MRDHRKKLDRANHHLAVINRAFGQFLGERDVCTLAVEHDAQKRQYGVRVVVERALPADFGLMVGDVVHNLRSALDALVYRLALRHSVSLTEKQMVDVQFLIVDKSADFDDRAIKRRGIHIHPEALAAMRLLQPFHGWSGTGQHPLTVLRELSNIDKHRQIVTALVSIASVDLMFMPSDQPKVFRNLTYLGPLEDGAEIGVIPELGGGMDPCTNVNNDLLLDIVFSHVGPVPGVTVRRTLMAISGHIENVVFPALEHWLV